MGKIIEQITRIARARGISRADAAQAIERDISNIYRIDRGEGLGSRETWARLIAWSDGEITPNDAMHDEIAAARSRQP